MPIARILCYNGSLVTWMVVKVKVKVTMRLTVSLGVKPHLGLMTRYLLPASRSRSHIATDGQSVSKSWCRAPSGDHDQIYITVWQLRSCFCGAPSLSRGWVCLLYMLLTLASAVILGSESLGTRDHILLSHIWDSPFRRLLRLAGSRWKYSTPPSHGCERPDYLII
jgi:hypothetical protein